MSNPDRPRFVRQFALTKGRAYSVGRDLPLDTLVQSNVDAAGLAAFSGEQLVILGLCRRPISIAEISAHLGVHLGIARVLVSDLAARRLVEVATGEDRTDGPDLETLERLLDDLKAL